MVVTAFVPVAAGTVVRLEALDVATSKPVQCATATTVADSAPAGSSSVSITVDEASCVEPHSGSLRICWTATSCTNFSFQRGKTVNLGVVNGTQAFTAPNTGGEGGERPTALALDLRYAAIALFALGACGLGVSALVWQRRRR